MESESQRWAPAATPESAGDSLCVEKNNNTTAPWRPWQPGTDDVRSGRILQGGRLHCCLHQRPPADTPVSWLPNQTTESHGDIITIIRINTSGASRRKRKKRGVKEGWTYLVNKKSHRAEVAGGRVFSFFCFYISLFRSTAWFPACLQSSTGHLSPARFGLWLPGWTAAWWLPHKLRRLSWPMDDDKRRQRKESNPVLEGRICTLEGILFFVNVGLTEVVTLGLSRTLCTSR